MTQQDLLIKQLLQKMEKWPISYIFWMKKDCTGSTVRWPLCCMYGSFDDEPEDILKVSESRWQIEACFRIMKTDFSARPVFVQRNDRIRAHFLVCFLALFIYRLLEKSSSGNIPVKS